MFEWKINRWPKILTDTRHNYIITVGTYIMVTSYYIYIYISNICCAVTLAPDVGILKFFLPLICSLFIRICTHNINIRMSVVLRGPGGDKPVGKCWDVIPAPHICNFKFSFYQYFAIYLNEQNKHSYNLSNFTHIWALVD